MKLIILTPGEKLYEGNITSIKVPGVNGQFEVLKNHAPIVSSLIEGEIRVVEKEGGKQTFKISQGFIEVLRNEVAVLVQNVIED